MDEPSEADRQAAEKLRRHGLNFVGPFYGYCVHDAEKVEIQNAKQIEMKNGKPAIKGTCPKCGGGVFKIGLGFVGAQRRVRCSCGHLDVNHSDLGLDPGYCYECPCAMFG